MRKTRILTEMMTGNRNGKISRDMTVLKIHKIRKQPRTNLEIAVNKISRNGRKNSSDRTRNGSRNSRDSRMNG